MYTSFPTYSGHSFDAMLVFMVQTLLPFKCANSRIGLQIQLLLQRSHRGQFAPRNNNPAASFCVDRDPLYALSASSPTRRRAYSLQVNTASQQTAQQSAPE